MSIVNLLYIIIATLAESGAEENCSLDALSPYSYMVKINDKEKTIAHGTILALRAVLTSCSSVDSQHTSYLRAIAGKVTNFTSEEKLKSEMCYQERVADRVECHPKAKMGPSTSGFDWGIVKLLSPFSVEEGASYPAMYFQNQPADMLLSIRLIDSLQEGDCEIPIFIEDKTIIPNVVFETNASVSPLGYCFKFFCSHSGNKDHAKYCENVVVNKEKEYHFFCALLDEYNLLPNLIIEGSGDFNYVSLNWYKGAPLICDGTAYGMTMDFMHKRAAADSPTESDFFFMVSYLRAWNFIVAAKHSLGSMIPQIFLVDQQLSSELITRPTKFTESNIVIHRDLTQDRVEITYGERFRSSSPEQTGQIMFKIFICFLPSLVISYQ